ncbi:MAG: hypothetical protein CL483_02780 [Acidobacteria bacterium]|nr:hypothetical protein [Acidobacteriota bacterium]
MTEDDRSPTLDRFLPYAAGIFVLALVIRVVHIFQIRPASFFPLLMGDAQSYHTWAQELAAGDWIGNEVFYQAPLYPYFLGLVYTVFGEGPLVVRMSQAVLGALACVLLAYAGWRLFSRTAGIVAGVMLACYAPAIFFDSLVQKSVLDAVLLCLTLALLSPLMTRPLASHSLGAWGSVGVAVALLVLSRENALVFVTVLLFWLVWSRRADGPRRWQLATAFVAGIAVVLLPVAARNLAVGGEFYLTTSQFGPNFYIGNNPGASGIYQPLRFGRGDPRFERLDATALAEEATGSSLTPAQVSRYWTGEALSYIANQPMDWARLMGRKIRLAWNASEVADTEDQLSYADRSLLLRLSGLVWHFGILAPLALVGVWACWARRRELELLYLMLGAYAVTLVAFAIMARYRYPLVPFLVLLAAVGVTRLPNLVRQTSRAQLAGLGAGVVALMFFCNWPMYSMAQMRAVTESNVGTELQVQGRVDEAITLYRDALTRNPNNAVAHSNLGTAYAAAGQLDDAIASHRTALELAPNDAEGYFNLANALASKGELEEAATQFREALRVDATFVEAHVNLGNALVDLGRFDDATAEYQRAGELRPEWGQSFNNLGLLASARGELEESITQFRRAIDVEPEYAEAHTNLAAALQLSGDTETALVHFRRAVELLPEDPAAHNDLGMALGGREAVGEALQHFRRAVELAPDFVEARGNLAMALRMSDEPAEAVAEYQEIIRLNPDSAVAHNELGITLAGQGQLDAALSEFRRAIELLPEFAGAYGNRGVVLQMQGDPAAAIASFEEALRLAPGSADLQARLDAARAELAGR